MSEIQEPSGLSKAEITQILDPALSLAERQSAWKKKPLSAQARLVQNNWKQALKGPYQLGLTSSVVAFFTLPTVYSEEYWMVGTTVCLIWYVIMIWAVFQMRQLRRLHVSEI